MQGVEEWQKGQVDYPARLAVPIDGARNYNAAVDIRSAPIPADEVIEADEDAAASEPVLVKCTIAARLTAIGSSLAVAEHPDESVGGWIMQEFTPTGVVEWSWTVTAAKPLDQQLRFDLRPAIVVSDESGDREYASQSITSFTTEVSVEASFLHRAAYWLEVHWPLIVGIASVVGLATLSVVHWIRQLRRPNINGAKETVSIPAK